MQHLLHDAAHVHVLQVEQLGNLVRHLHDDRPERAFGGELAMVEVEVNGVEVVLRGGLPARLPAVPQGVILVKRLPRLLLGLREPSEVQPGVEHLLRIPRARQHDPLIAHVHQRAVELVRLGYDNARGRDGVALLVVAVHLVEDAGEPGLGVLVVRLIQLGRPVHPGAQVPQVGRVLLLASVAVAAQRVQMIVPVAEIGRLVLVGVPLLLLACEHVLEHVLRDGALGGGRRPRRARAHYERLALFRRYVRAQLHHLGGVAEGGLALPKRRLRVRGRTRPGVVVDGGVPPGGGWLGLGPLLDLGRGHGLGRGGPRVGPRVGVPGVPRVGVPGRGVPRLAEAGRVPSAFACSAEKAGGVGEILKMIGSTGWAATFATMGAKSRVSRTISREKDREQSLGRVGARFVEPKLTAGHHRGAAQRDGSKDRRPNRDASAPGGCFDARRAEERRALGVDGRSLDVHHLTCVGHDCRAEWSRRAPRTVTKRRR